MAVAARRRSTAHRAEDVSGVVEKNHVSGIERLR
jgi:hypothetical protein